MSEQAVFDALAYCIEVDEYGTRWYYNAAGRLHRNNGPAVEWADGGNSWYINGKYMSEDEFNQEVKQSV